MGFSTQRTLSAAAINPLMGSRTFLPDVTYLAIMRTVNRSIPLLSLMDIEIADWLIRNPWVFQIAESHPWSIPGLVDRRVTRRVLRRALLTMPSTRQIDFEPPPNIRGVMGGYVDGHYDSPYSNNEF